MLPISNSELHIAKNIVYFKDKTAAFPVIVIGT